VLAEVVRYTEPDMAIVQCFKPLDAPCAIRPSCVLRRALEMARDAFMAVLEEYTLADLVQPRQRLAGLLGISQDARG
jgi:Rrf2 family nitric oxide-sensitive transcriptional repressor